jgi:hypothetical protein
LWVAGYFAAEPLLGNRIEHMFCDGFSCGKQDIKEKIIPAVLNVFFSATKVTFRQKAILLYSRKGVSNRIKREYASSW